MKALHRLRDFGLKLSIEKCIFFQTSVPYLGHVVSKNGVETDPAKIEALRSCLSERVSFLSWICQNNTLTQKNHLRDVGHLPAKEHLTPLKIDSLLLQCLLLPTHRSLTCCTPTPVLLGWVLFCTKSRKD